MGFTITDIAGHNNVQSYTINFDTAADFNAYDQSKIEPSSVALVLENATTYILNSQHVWVQV